MYTSERLLEGSIYTRKELQQKFDIKDATVNTGVFRLSGYLSIRLFVTEQKTKDRPQLKDYLDGDTLYWDGQPKGRTDKLIIGHASNDLELLVFYRKHRSEFTHFGFKYEGRFYYKSHTGSRPAQFVLRRIGAPITTDEKNIPIQQIEEVSYTEAEEIHKLGQMQFSQSARLSSTIAESGSPYKSEGLGVPYSPADEEIAISERDPFAVDPVLVERANRSHASTQNTLAKYLQGKGLEPRSPRPEEPNFDLAWIQNETIFVAEIKSLTYSNEEKQLRLGLGQVLRYRHLLAQRGKQVQAVMMLERGPSDQSWILLCEVLGVLLIWPDIISSLSLKAE